MKLPKHVQNILWDVDPRVVDVQKDAAFIIARITEKGAMSDVRWLKKQFSLRKIKTTVAASRNTSAKTKNFWRVV